MEPRNRTVPRPRAHFLMMAMTPAAIWIVDQYGDTHNQGLKPFPTVTNDADAVVAHVLYHYGPQRRIIYRDSAGERWDELVHDGKTFIGFRAGHEGLERPPECT